MKILKTIFICFVLTIFVSSCYQDKEFITIKNISIIADRSEKKTGDTITFTVKTDSGIDVTEQSQIIVNGVSNGNSELTSSIEQDFTVKAIYNQLSSNTITVSFKQLIVSFKKNVLIEDYTGTWCGNCTRVSYAIELLNQQIPDKIVTVGIHYGPTASNFDPYHFDVTPLNNLIKLQGYPKAQLNRITPWTSPQPNYLSEATSLTLGDIVKLGLAMNSSISGNNLNLDVKVKFVKDYSDLKLVVFVLENNLFYEQENYSSYYGNVNPVVNFEHDHVLRASFTNLLGDAISSSETLNGRTFTRNFSLPIPSSIANTSNIEFAAFVLDSNNKCINVRKSIANENQEFEVNQ